MLTAIISIKNNITNEIEIEGEAILLNCMDHQENKSFWETRLINNSDTSTHCFWIDNADIIENAE